MLKHLPNLIEVVGKIRAKTSKAILDNSTDNDLLYSIKNNCLLCEEHIKQIYKTINEIHDNVEKTRLLALLENISSETKKCRSTLKIQFFCMMQILRL